MGGTSFDVSLINDSSISLSTEGEVAGYRVAKPMIDIHTIGAGGGSIAWIDQWGMHFTENDTSLFGFESQEEKELFLRLISVKGLGPKTAMNMHVTHLRSKQGGTTLRQRPYA